MSPRRYSSTAPVLTDHTSLNLQLHMKLPVANLLSTFPAVGFARLCSLITSVSSSSFVSGMSVKIHVRFIFWLQAFPLQASAFGNGLISCGVIIGGLTVLLLAGGDERCTLSPALSSQPTVTQCSSIILSAHKSLACEYIFKSNQSLVLVPVIETNDLCLTGSHFQTQIKMRKLIHQMHGNAQREPAQHSVVLDCKLVRLHNVQQTSTIT